MESKPTREQTEQAAATWLLKRQDPQWSERDQAALDQWLAAAPGHRVSFIRLESIWTETDRLQSIASGLPSGQVPPRGAIEKLPFFAIRKAEAAESAVVSVNGAIDRYGKPGKRWAVAASVLLAIAAGIAFHSIDLASSGKSYRTSVGGLATVPTPDGSIVTLNTDSEIDVRFTKGERRIELKKGEAFFEVAKDAARPFTVYVDRQRVVAIGTKFSVRLQPDIVRVAVTEGKVRLERQPAILGLSRFSRAVPDPRNSLVAGSVVDVQASRISVAQRSIPEIEQTLSWRTGYLLLNDTPLNEAVAEFNRYNTRQLMIGDAELAGLRVEGNFRPNNVDGFVRLLEQGFAVEAEVAADDRIVLYKK